MAKFLSTEWFAAAQKVIDGSADVANAAKGKKALVQQIVTNGPNGDVVYSMRFDDGKVEIACGKVENADFTLTVDYETLGKIRRGQLSGQAAVMMGKAKIDGDLTRLMALHMPNQKVEAALNTVPTEY